MPDPNPYDFVPLEATAPVRKHWNSEGEAIDRYHPERFSGRLICQLKPETPLFIHGEGQQGKSNNERRSFCRINNRPAIHASSIKGALRSIYEIVTDSCLSALSDQYPKTSIAPAKRMPAQYTPCHDVDGLCPACRLFGMVETAKNGDDDAGGLAGRLLFSDAFSIKTSSEWRRIPAVGGGPQPRHGAFYFQNGGSGQVLGRKLYYHHQDYQKTIRSYGNGGKPGLMEVELHTSTFQFSVDFINLSADELNFLCYALLLEENIRHHIGFGKPYGLGSARITISELALTHHPGLNPVNRFLRLEPTAPVPVDAAGCALDGKAQWLHRAGSTEAYQQFRHILAWPGRALYKYPTFQWFRNTTGTGTITLAAYQSGVRTPAATPTATPTATPAPTSTPTQGSTRQTGSVDMFNDQKGFGFIIADNKQRLFVHFTDIRGHGQRSLQAGQRVEFDVVPGDKGPKAQDVVVVI